MAAGRQRVTEPGRSSAGGHRDPGAAATDYEKAVSWYQAINERPERDGSALQGHVVPLYPQGSMAICIDIVAKTRAAARLDPERVLDLLFDTTRGEPDSRYYAMSDRDRA